MLNLQRATRGINFVLVIGSALLTGVFGYTFGGSNFLLSCTFFLIFAALSLLVPILSEYTGQQAHYGNMRVAAISGSFALIFGVYDVATNFGTGALFRELEMNSASVVNTKAKDIRGEVSRLNDRISSIKQQTAWQTTYLAPEAYDSIILKLKNETERGRNVFQRSRECTDTTLESSQRVCQGIADATANKANALSRQALKDEMRQLEKELVEAKAASVDAPTVASAAITHARNAAAALTGSMDPGATSLFWANYGLTFSAALACTLAGFVTSLLLGWMQPPRSSQLDAFDDSMRVMPPKLLEATHEAAEAGSEATRGMAYVRETEPVRVRLKGGHEATVPPETARALRHAGLLDEITETVILTPQAPTSTAVAFADKERSELLDQVNGANDQVSRKLADMKRRLAEIAAQGTA